MTDKSIEEKLDRLERKINIIGRMVEELYNARPIPYGQGGCGRMPENSPFKD